MKGGNCDEVWEERAGLSREYRAAGCWGVVSCCGGTRGGAKARGWGAVRPGIRYVVNLQESPVEGVRGS